MTDETKLVFGKHALIRRLALGGMGEVFLARQTGTVAGTERLVILKSLLPELAEQDGFIDQFLDEARVASKLNHPNIVQMLEAGRWNGVYFIAMEYIRGENLSRITKLAKQRSINVPVHIVVRIVRDALLGLGYAHSARDELTGQPLAIIHRDVSPQNLMVRADGVTKVVDFGIAKAGNRSSRTATGVLKGKIQYMAPEQVRGEELDPRADQFAVGVVLWELVTGQRLFTGDNEIHILRSVLTQDLAPPSSVVVGFPLELEAAIMRMLERDPSKRFPSCEAAADALTEWLNQGSRRVSEADVARWVQEVVGEDLDDVVRNLTPATNNFLMGLHGASAGAKVASAAGESTIVRSDRHRNRAGMAAAAVAVAALGAAGFIEVAGLGGAPAAAPTADLQTVGATGSGPRGAPVVASPPRLEGGTLTLQIDAPVGATIIVDDVAVSEKVPATLRGLTPVAHRVVVVAADGTRQDVPFILPAPTVIIKSDPTGAAVLGDGAPLGLTPVETDRLPPGNHEVVVNKDGFTSQRQTVRGLLPGERRELTFKLARVRADRVRPLTPERGARPAGGTPCFGSLTINTTPWSRVSIDGEPYGTTPLVVRRITGGPHRVTFEREGQGTVVNKTVTATCDTAVKVNITLP